jgi:TIR domain/Pentapeptide repeats (8 copies)
MAGTGDVEIVQGGTDSIREYRKSHEGWDRPFDLRAADLSGLLLAGADLGGADLSGARLVGATLTDCNLSQANLTKAVLVEAVLTRCRMREASLCATDATASRFQSCDLRRANAEESTFEKASLVGASLISGNWAKVNASATDLLRADLSFSRWRGSNLHGAAMSSTVMAATDLGGVLGLDSVVFDGPCPIDDSTIRTIDPLVQPFLRGCGLPDELIDFYMSAAGAMQYYTVFISYSTAQQGFADQIYASLQTEGLRVWLATEDLKTGDRFRQVIYDEIRLHDKLLLVLSRESVASEWVEDEVNAALAREREEGRSILFPITLDNSLWQTDQAWVRALSDKRHVCDFTQWRDAGSYRSALERLLRDLRM